MDETRVIISQRFRRELDYHRLSERTLAEAAILPEHFIETSHGLPEGPIFPLSRAVPRRPQKKSDNKKPKAYRLQVKTVYAGTPPQKCRVLLFITVKANGAYEPNFVGLLFERDFPAAKTADPLYALLIFAKAFGSPLKHLGTNSKYLYAASVPAGFVFPKSARVYLPNHLSVIISTRSTRHTKERTAEGEREAYEERSTIVFAIAMDYRRYGPYLARHGIEPQRATQVAQPPGGHFWRPPGAEKKRLGQPPIRPK